MKEITINFKLLEDNDITINEYLNLYKIHFDNTETNFKYEDMYSHYQSLEIKGFIKIIVTVADDVRIVTYLLREKANLLIQDSTTVKLRKTKKAPVDNNVLILVENNINSYRSLFKPLKRGAMGSPEGCKTKLTRWLTNNPIYTFEDIINATKLYIKEFEGDYRYLQQADYFIYKKEGVDEQSRLSTYVEELSNNTPTSNDDWTSSLT